MLSLVLSYNMRFSCSVGVVKGAIHVFSQFPAPKAYHLLSELEAPFAEHVVK